MAAQTVFAHKISPFFLQYRFSTRNCVRFPATSSPKTCRLSGRSSANVISLKLICVSSSSPYPIISAKARLTCKNLPSALLMEMPMGADLKSVRKRSSLARSSISARWRSAISCFISSYSRAFSSEIAACAQRISITAMRSGVNAALVRLFSRYKMPANLP